jgi:hypothetical protein
VRPSSGSKNWTMANQVMFGTASLMLGAALLCATMAVGQAVPVVTGDGRVDKLLSQMTLQEKLTLIHGTHEDPAVYQGQAGYLAGIPRLGIPGLRFADGPARGADAASITGRDGDHGRGGDIQHQSRRR